MDSLGYKRDFILSLFERAGAAKDRHDAYLNALLDEQNTKEEIMVLLDDMMRAQREQILLREEIIRFCHRCPSIRDEDWTAFIKRGECSPNMQQGIIEEIMNLSD